ncbi:MAG TPA: pantoate--beta-alanine ligase [Candidatus Binataceae bacterium]|nr:pantoate--beta-alanine ligase [Candidatus Binataceae bacterium]
MKIIESPAEMQSFAETARRRGERIALVPTMGYLHEGHLSLMREGRRCAAVLVSSLFVNPTQFGPREDLSSYPRDMERDCRLMESVPVDVLFAPDAAAMYPAGAQTWVEVTELTQGLCGEFRPGHFRGVTTVVAKLFNIVKPHVALFGAKDYQQLCAIRQMVRDLNFDVEILPMPTVREPDGLAMSSRNAYLSPVERVVALSLSRALEAARTALARGERNPHVLARTARAELEREAEVAVEYVEVRDALTLAEIGAVSAPAVIAIAARVGRTRLIDNTVLEIEVRNEK